MLKLWACYIADQLPPDPFYCTNFYIADLLYTCSYHSEANFYIYISGLDYNSYGLQSVSQSFGITQFYCLYLIYGVIVIKSELSVIYS